MHSLIAVLDFTSYIKDFKDNMVEKTNAKWIKIVNGIEKTKWMEIRKTLSSAVKT